MIVGVACGMGRRRSTFQIVYMSSRACTCEEMACSWHERAPQLLPDGQHVQQGLHW